MFNVGREFSSLPYYVFTKFQFILELCGLPQLMFLFSVGPAHNTYIIICSRTSLFIVSFGVRGFRSQQLFRQLPAIAQNNSMWYQIPTETLSSK